MDRDDLILQKPEEMEARQKERDSTSHRCYNFQQKFRIGGKA